MVSNNKLAVTLAVTLFTNVLVLFFVLVKSTWTSNFFDQYFNQTFVHLDVDKPNISLRDIVQLHHSLLTRTTLNTDYQELYNTHQHISKSVENYLIQLLLTDPLTLNLFSKYDTETFETKQQINRHGQQRGVNGERDKRSTFQNNPPVASENEIEKFQDIFSSLTTGGKSKFRAPVSTVLIPALMQFENLVIKKIETLHDLIVSHDLRLEVLEKAMLSTTDVGHVEVQSDDLNNKSELENAKDIIRLEELLPVANGSALTEMKLTEDGSGESEHVTIVQTTTHKPTHVMPWKAPEYYEIFRHLTAVEQKVLALENYNVMSDSELNRVRSEVIRLDDKVTELDRRNTNLQVRMSMHAVKISELELFKNKAETTIQTSQESYGRVNTRLETFKDRLTEIKTELRGVTSQFSRHDQITNELRAADSYKAHDIQEMRKSIFGLEGRLTSLYTILDQNIQMMQADVKSVVDRICSTNKISC